MGQAIETQLLGHRDLTKNKYLYIQKCKKHFIKMLEDVGMVVPKTKETRSTNYAYTTM